MLRQVKNIVRAALVFICLSVLFLCLVGCDKESDGDKHDFNFNLPDNFASLSVDEQLQWGEENGYLIIKLIDGKIELENSELLYSFLENKEEEKELLIMRCFEYKDGKNIVSGVYFDGESYCTKRYGKANEDDSLVKYRKCGIEEYSGVKYLYVSNDETLTVKDYYLSLASSDSNKIKEFSQKYYVITPLGEASESDNGNDGIEHDFNFNMPDNFASLSAEEQMRWAKENGYLIIKFIDGKIELENSELLYSFLENKEEEKELLIMEFDEYEDGPKNTVYGVYFDGESYYAKPPYGTVNGDDFFKYRICGIEEFLGYQHLYVSNDETLTVKDYYVAGASSDRDAIRESHQEILVIATVGKLEK